MNKDEIDAIGAATEGAAAGLTRSFQELALMLAGPAFKQYGMIWEDRVKFKRAVGLIKLAARLKELVPGNTPTQTVPLKTLVPALNAASLEQDEVLQEMWARLLASAATTTRVQPYFVKYLADLSRIDADLLEFLWIKREAAREEKKEEDAFGRLEWTHFSTREAREEVFVFLHLPDDEEGNHALGLALEHVCALGLVQPVEDSNGIIFVSYALTIQGVSLLEVCRPASN